MSPVASGLAVLAGADYQPLVGRRLGLLTHAAAVAADLRPSADLLAAAGLDLRLLFGPEHGLAGQVQDMQPVAAGPGAAVPVISLYGDTADSLAPSTEQLAGIDCLLVDLQDVGCRTYTYASTMRACMAACGRAGVAVVVLDRPNPIGGRLREGPLLDGDCRSFVGAFQVPQRHGLTLGELARLAQREGVEVELEVIGLRGWRRGQWFDETGLPWVLPSPNMPALDTATVYPGSVLVEATALSEGRGITRPFEILGAPWIDGRRLAADLERFDLPGLRVRPLTFRPAFHKHAGRDCGGIQLHVVDRQRFRPVLTGAAVLQAARTQAPDDFAWRSQPYEFEPDRPAIDLISGSPELRRCLDAGGDVRDLLPGWQRRLQRFNERLDDLLLYP